MRPDVVGPALDAALDAHPGAKIYYPSPIGQLLNQKVTRNLSKGEEI